MPGGHRWNPKGKLNPAYKGGKIADRDWFYQKYVVEEKSLREVAREANRSLRTAARWAEKHGVRARTPVEAKRVKPNPSGSAHPRWQEHAIRNCCDCNRSFGQISYSPRCWSCESVRRRTAYRGANNPNYKGYADIKLVIREHSNSYWRPLVYARDDYTCLHCGDARGGNLRAHHIYPFAKILEEVLMSLPLESEEDRKKAVDTLITHHRVNDVDNGLTLCAPCHEKEHAAPDRRS